MLQRQEWPNGVSVGGRKWKSDKPRGAGQRSVDGRERGSGSHVGCYLLLRQRRGEVRKNMPILVGDAP